MSKNDGGAAFPCEGGHLSGLHAHPGMTLRDYIAIKIASAFLSEIYTSRGKINFSDNYAVASKASYEFADEMLKVRDA